MERLRLSARPWIGIETRWSASAASSSGRPCASLPNSHAVGPSNGCVVQADARRRRRWPARSARPPAASRPRPRRPARRPAAGGRGCRRWPAPSWGCRRRPRCPRARPGRRRPRRRSGRRCRRCPGHGRRRRPPPAGGRPRAGRRAAGRRTGTRATTPAGVTLSLSEARARSSTRVQPRRGLGERGVPLRGRRASRRPRRRSRGWPAPLDGLRAVGEEQPPLGSLRTTAELACLLDPGRARRSGAPRGAQAEASTLGALTSSGRAALATSTRALNAAMSLTARSARTLRSTSTPARPRPWMKRL